MNCHLAFAGSGAVGAPAALLAAQALPEAQITVLSVAPPPGRRTFVLGTGTCLSLAEHELWAELAPCGHELQQVRASFAGSFGEIELAAADIMAPQIGYSFAEDDYLAAIHNLLAQQANVNIIDNARIERISAGPGAAQIFWQGGKKELACDLVAVAGLPPPILEAIGFGWRRSSYLQEALALSISGGKPGTTTSERIHPSGAMTLIPRRDGWGHVWLDRSAELDRISALSATKIQALIEDQHGLKLGSQSRIGKLGRYRPTLRLAEPAAIGRVLLLGSSACTLHPVGAQELNLGLRDCMVLSESLAATAKAPDDEFAMAFARRRAADRQRTATLTDWAAKVLDWQLPGKVALGGLFAFAAGLCPAARRRLLATWVLG